MHTVFENEHYIHGKDSKSGKWVRELNFYHGDLTNVDFKTDWRFCEVKDRRKLVKILGTAKELKFPIIYPIILDDESIITDTYEKIEYDNEDKET